MDLLGRHILVEYHECNKDLLNDVAAIRECMLAAALAASATIVEDVFHQFSPLGVSGVVVIKESHLAIHTWPESRYAAVDIFTCGDSMNPWEAHIYLKKAFEAGYETTMEVRRGPLKNK
ncbi:UNVERIFIED_CONTAM: hypothetical protein GTU68_028140 [Idotea baltica]|nr:hypothetical protein [Idotea baltica]